MLENPKSDIARDYNKEEVKELNISEVNPDNLDDVIKFLRFESERGFTDIRAPGEDFEEQLKNFAIYRQGLMRDEGLHVATAKEGNDLLATASVITENNRITSGNKGKELEKGEAYAAGTQVKDEAHMSSGVGARMAAEQHRIAKEAGKTHIKTLINSSNGRSLRLRMNLDYNLVKVNLPKEKDDAPEYIVRKDLTTEQSDHSGWVEKIKSKSILPLEGSFAETTPNEVLVPQEDYQKVNKGIENGYVGVHLLFPDSDFKNLPRGDWLYNENMIVFVKS